MIFIVSANKMVFSQTSSQSQKITQWEVSSVKDRTIYFKNGEKFETPLYGLKYIGQIKTEKKIPFLIMSGRECDECDENTSIYIFSPSDGQMKGRDLYGRYSYPGKIKNMETNVIDYESRMFYGKVMNSANDGVIWFERFLAKDGKRHNRVFLVTVQDDKLTQNAIDKGMPPLSETLKLVNERKCFELKGIDGYSEP